MKNTKYIILAIVILISACGKIPESVTGNYNGHDYVDMGTSVMWATYNVGAQTPTEYGDYVAWGEIESQEYYNWNTYKYGYSHKDLTKYCTNPEFGNVDNLSVLQPEDDYAFIKWGEKWRTPTKEEWDELFQTCEFKYIINSTGRKGYIVTAKNGNQIFLPLGGGKVFDYPAEPQNQWGFYWTASIVEEHPYSAWCVFLTDDSDDTELATYMEPLRCRGYSVRAVFAKD